MALVSSILTPNHPVHTVLNLQVMDNWNCWLKISSSFGVPKTHFLKVHQKSVESKLMKWYFQKLIIRRCTRWHSIGHLCKWILVVHQLQTWETHQNSVFISLRCFLSKASWYSSFRNGLCYQFLHTNANTVKVDLQIAIGCIENIQAPECIDIRFCSRKGAKPQKKIARYTVWR